MKRIAMVLLAACAPEPHGPQTREEATALPTAANETDQRIERARREGADAERARIAMLVASDVAKAMGELSVDAATFNDLAMRLYFTWAAKYPDRAKLQVQSYANVKQPQPVPQTSPAPAPAPPQRHEEPTTGWWCTSSIVDGTDVCLRDSNRCDAIRNDSHRGGPLAWRECTETARVACFGYHDVLDKEDPLRCAASFAACNVVQATFAKATDDFTNVTKCKATD